MLTDLSSHPDFIRWPLALGGAIVISGLAYFLRSLSFSGMFAAIILGTTLVGAAGWWSGVLLIIFFMTSSILSSTGRRATTIPTDRGNQRDAIQVFANGGTALGCAIGFVITDHPAWLVALAGSLAAANADTWSTELGRTSPSAPRLITNGRVVPAGTSGAVSRRGLVAAAGGAFLIGTLTATGGATNGFAGPYAWALTLVAATGAGFLGSLVDSLIGATVQVQRWCDSCGNRTEQRIHRCGTVTSPMSGLSWVTNDVVNGACTLTGALLASGFVELLA